MTTESKLPATIAISELSPERKRTLIRKLAAKILCGKSANQAGAELGLRSWHVYPLIKSEAFIAEKQLLLSDPNFREKVIMAGAGVLAGLLPKALEVSEGLLESQDEKIRLTVAQDVMDRVGLTAPKQVEARVIHELSPASQELLKAALSESAIELPASDWKWAEVKPADIVVKKDNGDD